MKASGYDWSCRRECRQLPGGCRCELADCLPARARHGRIPAAAAKSYYAEQFDTAIRVLNGGSIEVTETVVFRFERAVPRLPRDPDAAHRRRRNRRRGARRTAAAVRHRERRGRGQARLENASVGASRLVRTRRTTSPSITSSAASCVRQTRDVAISSSGSRCRRSTRIASTRARSRLRRRRRPTVRRRSTDATSARSASSPGANASR